MKFLYEENNTVYAECDECGKVLKFRKNDLIETSYAYFIPDGMECFCLNKDNKISGIPQKESSEHTTHPVGVPKCPTCGSTDVEKIPVSSKVAGGIMLGLFSSNVRKTYRCNTCKYKW